jgi:hypothetical protein
MCCNVVIKVIFNTPFSSVICYRGKFYFEDIFYIFNFILLSGENYLKSNTTGCIFLSNYSLSRFLKQPGNFVFFLLGCKFKLIFEISQNFEV